MIEFVFIALFQAAVAGAEPAPAATAAPVTEQQAQQTPAAEPERVRCRLVTMEGSNLRQRRCTTASQDEELNQESARMMRDVQSQSGRTGSRFGDP